jgi:predicted small metal-binding protein
VSKAKAERRANPSLREVLDELVAHVRHVANDSKTMSQQDLDYAQERLEWLAEEVWRAVTERRNRN